MRILLVQNLAYVPAHGGANKANRVLVEGLAARGHECRVVAAASPVADADARARLLEELASRGIEVISSSREKVVFRHRGVEVYTLISGRHLHAELQRQAVEFEPTWTLVSSEDPGQSLLETALAASPARVLSVVQTTLALPFGPAAFLQSPGKAELFRRAAGVITISRYMRDYLREWGGVESDIIQFPVYGPGPFPIFGDFARGSVTMINPSGIKGVSIFAALARRMPDVEFAAVTTWGTTAEDRRSLKQLSNVRLLPPADDIDEVLSRTRVLLAPSLWGEVFGYVVVDAMLRGIPVLASDVGGVPEAKLGVDYVLPVNPITHYEERLDERRLPVPVIPPQDIGPWARALRRLVSERGHYERLSEASREAALSYVSKLGIEPFEKYLEGRAPAEATARAATTDEAHGGAAGRLDALSPERRALLAMLLKEKTARAAPDSIARREQSEPPRLSFAQQRLWFLQQLEPHSALYNIPAVVRLNGSLNVAALRRSLDELMRRHESLRTTFADLGADEPVQVIHTKLELPLALEDLRSLSPGERESRTRSLTLAEAQRPFDLEAGPLVRAMLLWLGEEEHMLLLTMHHIVSDGWSIGILIREVGALYEAFSAGRPSPLAEPPIQYADFAVWQRERMSGDALEAQLGYWRRQLGGSPAALELPADRPRPVARSYRGAKLSTALPVPLHEALKSLSQRHDCTLFMTMLAAFYAMLSRYTDRGEIAVGTPIAGRNRAETEGLIGFFVNTLVLRADLSGDPTFSELLAQVRRMALEAYAYQDVPFEKLVEELQPERSLSHTPFFNVMFALHNMPMPTLRLAGLSLDLLPADTVTAKFDLTLKLEEVEGEMTASWVFNADLFEAATIERMAGHYHRLLEGVVADPSARVSSLPLMDAAERRRLLVEWNDTAVTYDAGRRSLHQLFEEQAARTPDAAALVFKDERLTFAELNVRANRLAHHLRGLGVGPEVLVGVLMERSVEMVVSLLAALKAGGAYVPVDPAYPPARIALTLEDARVKVLLTQGRLLQASEALSEVVAACGAHVVCLERDRELIERESAESPLAGVSADNLAYVIYTSGSTGRPKGVMIRNAAAVNLLGALRAAVYARHAAPLRVGMNAPLAFDASVKQWLQLLAGHALVLVPDELRASGDGLLAYAAEQGVDVLDCTPSQLRLLMDADSWQTTRLPSLMLVGGEAIDGEMWAQLGAQSRVDFYNVYGPTECTVDATAARVRDAGPSPNIGRPLANVRAYVLDARMSPVPLGVAGEVYVGGYGLARGYLNRPDLTAERFVPDPYSSEPGARLYKTGDLARFLPGGELEYQGRADHQVKVRGFRVELGEIEAAVSSHEHVRECVVVTHQHSNVEARLIAFFVAEDARQSVPASELRSHIKLQLPEHMIPASFVALDSLPLTPNGKLDRRRLRELADGVAPGGERNFVEARTPTEEILTRVWAEVLGVGRVGVHDNFFELGGHSLLATRITSRVRAAFGVEVPLRRLFESPTVAEMAEDIERLMRGRHGPELPPVERLRRDAEPALSFAQRRLWFLARLEPESPSYNIAAAVRLKGVLLLPALEATFSEIIRRHESLRTIFPARAGRPAQRVLPADPAHIPVESIAHVPEGAREAEARRLLEAEAHRPFDVARGPLLRITLLRLTDDEHILLLVMHHIISDGWSMGLLVREVAALYGAFASGAASPLAEPPVQYADFAEWQHRWLQGDALDKQLAFWTEQLAGVPLLHLLTDRPRPAVQSYRGARFAFELPAATVSALERLSRQEGVTTFMTLMAAFQAFLYRYTRQGDIAVGTPIAGRNRAETEGLIGCFVNTLVIRTRPAPGMTFRELLSRVREAALGAYAHQDAPFEMLVEKLQPERSLSHTPLFQVMLSLQNAAAPVLDMQGLAPEPLDVELTTAKFDLTLNLLQRPGRVGGFVEYNTDLFDAATVGRMFEEFRTLLEGATQTPGAKLSELPLLPEAELRRLLVEFNQTAAAYPRGECIHRLFERQAGLTPDAVAVSFGASSMTYGELDREANRLAHYLRHAGVVRETLVGICINRSAEMLVGLLAILKAGGAYLPLDVTYPRERLAFILEDAGASVLLTHSSLAEELPAHSAHVVRVDAERAAIERESAESPLAGASADNLAYVIYTSGSTGRPKGVCITHEAIVNFLTSMSAQPGLASQDVLLSVTTLSFDIAGLEIFLPLAVGARVVIADGAEAQNGAQLAGLLSSHGVTAMQATPSTWRLLITAGWDGDERLKVLCGGEALPAELADQLLVRCDSLWNLYGPTETTIWSSAQFVAPTDESVLIGVPIANTQIYVLDDAMRPVPLGAPGELYIGGAGLARGYLKRPALTAERFVPDPYASEPGARLYKTGDLARHRPNGKIEYLGRIDNQVKLRGHRIELGEIEAVLGRHAAVRECAVVLREERASHQRLAAYLVVEEGESPPSPDELREQLAAHLPAYMIPSVFTHLEAMPLTPNGKLDRRALPEPAQAQPAASAAPQTAAEKLLAGIFGQILGVEHVGGDEDFFNLGGHSLLVIELLHRIREVFRAEPPLRDFLARPTVRNAVELMARTWGGREVVEEIAQTYLEVYELSEQEMKLLFAEEDGLSNEPVSDNT